MTCMRWRIRASWTVFLLKIAAIQLRSGTQIEENLRAAETHIRAAAGEAATFIATPELTDQMIAGKAEKLKSACAQDDHPGVLFFSNLAKDLKIDLLIGSMCIKTAADKLANRSFLFGRDGAIKATYDKIHLYDVDLPNGESHRESKIFEGGVNAVVAALSPPTQPSPLGEGGGQNAAGIREGGKRLLVGITICYDLRFPHLYRDLAKAGAEILSIPAAFTVPTGLAHWEVLLRARAIECGAFVIAPAQGGVHESGRVTYGHSMIISPWGQILAHKDDDAPGYIVTEINLDDVQKARQAIPSLKHDRDYFF